MVPIQPARSSYLCHPNCPMNGRQNPRVFCCKKGERACAAYLISIPATMPQAIMFYLSFYATFPACLDGLISFHLTSACVAILPVCSRSSDDGAGRCALTLRMWIAPAVGDMRRAEAKQESKPEPAMQSDLARDAERVGPILSKVLQGWDNQRGAGRPMQQLCCSHHRDSHCPSNVLSHCPAHTLL